MTDSKHRHFFFNKEISGGANAKTKKFLRGYIARAFRSIGMRISYASTKSYGAFSLSFGLLTLLLHLGEYYFLEHHEIAGSSLIIGAAFAIFGIPLMFFDKPMCIAVQEFPLTDYILFEFFSIKRIHRISNPPKMPIFAAILLGTVPAVLGFFFSPVNILVILLFITVLALSFVSPEFCIILMFLCLPYANKLPYSHAILVVMSIIGFVSFVFRVILGKRVFHFDTYGVLILIFGLMVAIGGFLGYGEETKRNTWAFLATLLSYFPVSSLVVNRRIADASLKAIVFSTVPVSVYITVSRIFEVIKNGFGPVYYGGDLGGKDLFITDAYLIVGALFSIMFAIEHRSKFKKTLYVVYFSLCMIAIFLSAQVSSILCILLCAFVTLFLFSKKISTAFVVPAVLLPYLIPLVPSVYLDKISAALGINPSISETVEKLGERLSVMMSNAVIGIGIGEESYSIVTGTSGPTANNLFFGIATAIGITGLMFFIAVMISKLVHTARYSPYVKNSSVHLANRMSTVAFFGLLIYGAFGNIFDDFELFFLFFAIFGISTATLRDAKKEYEDRVGYYDDARSSESSAIDIIVP